ncbi:Hypothetical protein A7982_06630 [Minicystis rosea]|nr:Hypothetical protein A7982_06630 [Minicystis rosea]
MTSMRISSCLALLVLVPACSAPESVASVEEELSSTPYVEMTSRLDSAQLAFWETASAGLIHSFDDVCGDTYCSGDYANLSTIALTCSINDAGRVKQCGWKLGGSIEYVDGATGQFSLDARTFNCIIPVKSDVNTFLTALDDNAFYIKGPLPTGDSFYHGIGACLAGVVGDPPPASTGTTYQEIADYFNDHGDPGFWFGTRRNVAEAFDASCASTYCQGEWSHITALRFVCSTNQETGEVKSCRFTFAASNPTVNENGHVGGPRKILQCKIKTHGPAAALEAALSGSDPLHATLPGSGTTIASQLDSCL